MVLLIASADVLVLVAAALGQIHFEENFDDDTWKDRWVTSTHAGATFGKFERTNGTYYGDPDNTGLRTMEDDKDYTLSTKFSPFNMSEKTLVLQFSVKYEGGSSFVPCGKGHLTLYDWNFKPTDAHKDTPYFLTFGPYFCDYLALQVNFLGGQRINSKIDWEQDKYTHVYTLILETDMTYQVLIDGEKVPSERITNNPPEKPIGSRNVTFPFPSICGIGLVFTHYMNVKTFDNILLSNDVHVAEMKRKEILDDMWVRQHTMRFAVDARMERLRTPLLVDIDPEDLTRVLNSDKNIEFNHTNHNNQTNFFLVEFDKFLVPFDWSRNNTAIRAAAEYNKHHGASNQSIQLWVSFQPQNENISDDVESVLEVVNEVNSIAARTITVIVINYGFLELDKQTLPFVNKEIQRVKNKLKSLPAPVPKLALQIADTNCKQIQSLKYLDINKSEFLVMTPMPHGKKFPKINELLLVKALLHCKITVGALDRRGSFILDTHSSIEIDFERGIYKYDKWVAKNAYRETTLVVIHAADKMLRRKDMVDTEKGTL